MTQLAKIIEIGQASGLPKQTVDAVTLQKALIDLGFPLPRYGADGMWGQESQTALKNAATKYGLYYRSSQRSGSNVVVAPAGLAILILGIRDVIKSNIWSGEASRYSAYVSTFSIQKMLNVLGYLSPEQVDGKLGPITQAAIASALSKFGGGYISSRQYITSKTTIMNAASAWLMLFAKSRQASATTPIASTKQDRKETKDSSKQFPSVEVQKLLLKLGASLPKYGADGKWGKESDTALQTIATKYGLKYKSSSRNGANVIVWPDDLIPRLTKISKKQASTADEAIYDAKIVQSLLLKLGITLPKYGADGKWGNESATGLKAAAQKYRFNYKNSARSGSNVLVSPKDLISKLTDKAQAAPIKPTKPKEAETKDSKQYESIAVQKLLLKLGMSMPKYGADGKWGIESDNALRQAATKYGYKYNSSAKSGKTFVIISPADLIKKLQSKIKTDQDTTAPTKKDESVPTIPGMKGKGYIARDVQKLLIGLGAKIKETGIWDRAIDTPALANILKKYKLTEGNINLYTPNDVLYKQGTFIELTPGDSIPKLKKILIDLKKNGKAKDKDKKKPSKKDVKKVVDKAKEDKKKADNQRNKAKNSRNKADKAKKNAKTDKEKQIAALLDRQAKKDEESAKGLKQIAANSARQANITVNQSGGGASGGGGDEEAVAPSMPSPSVPAKAEAEQGEEVEPAAGGAPTAPVPAAGGMNKGVLIAGAVAAAGLLFVMMKKKPSITKKSKSTKLSLRGLDDDENIVDIERFRSLVNHVAMLINDAEENPALHNIKLYNLENRMKDLRQAARNVNLDIPEQLLYRYYVLKSSL